ncbi:hypothetical protein FF2_023155 [Malus domestica]
MSESRGNDEKPDNFNIPIALKACAKLRALACGKTIYGFVMVGRVNPDRVTLVSAISACAQFSAVILHKSDCNYPILP